MLGLAAPSRRPRCGASVAAAAARAGTANGEMYRIEKCTIDAVTSATNGSSRATGQNRPQPGLEEHVLELRRRQHAERAREAEHDHEAERHRDDPDEQPERERHHPGLGAHLPPRERALTVG